ncbi:Translation initiation factor 2 subunit beta [Labeo rohita]|uniref:Translation initiation factor 2 subunit beta n=1 Tax=Labeo rohita TaxID=84645 RepID=A0ABQ8L624_LABRO|nr:Translation initiation factor 2 subunit beta [Labeo rohita]
MQLLPVQFCMLIAQPPAVKLLKMTKVLIRNGNMAMEAYAVLDDGSEQTIILKGAVQKLRLAGEPEDLILRTVRQDTQVIHGAAVIFTVSPTVNPSKAYKICNTFTAKALCLAEHTHPVSVLHWKFNHLAGTSSTGTPWWTGSSKNTSEMDKETIQLLQENTVRVEIDGVQCYATPLLCVKNMPPLYALKEAVLPQLRGIEKRLERDPELAAAYQEELTKLVQAGYVVKLSQEQVDRTREAWYSPHHMVRLLPQDKPLLRYIWRDMQRDRTQMSMNGSRLAMTLQLSAICQVTFSLKAASSGSAKATKKPRNQLLACTGIASQTQ